MNLLPRDRRTASALRGWLMNGQPLPMSLAWIHRDEKIKHDCLSMAAKQSTRRSLYGTTMP